MVRAIAVSGFKKSGKTKVVEELVEGLKNRGYRVGTIKHVPKEGFTVDQPETDSWRHAQAGAQKIVVISPEETAALEKRKDSLEEVLHQVEDLDFVVIEGFRDTEIASKIMVARDKQEAEELDDELTVGFIETGIGKKPVIDRDEIGKIIDLAEEKAIPPLGGLDCGECGYETCKEFASAVIAGEAPRDDCIAFQGPVSLKVDGKRVPLKRLIKDLIARTISGMISSLKETEGHKIELEIEKHEG